MDEPETERRILKLLEDLADVPPDERELWIDGLSGDSDAVRARLREILATSRLDHLQTAGAMGLAQDDLPPPEQVGGYRLTGQIGRGGMGAVYRAERSRGDFDHVVAVKLIKPGLLSDRLVERFLRERQTLASLEHENIARLYDGGATDDGTPYIVMELVDGEPITHYCESNGLGRDARLRLMETACRAIAFAHSNLVIHRDVTPSNVLVTRDGVVKLIDFGIARPTAAEVQAEGTSRSLASLSLTPGFAAPERMTGGETTTAADIYSLGKLLERVVTDRDPEIDAVIARATAIDPAERHPTADALADDIEALRTGFPVSALAHRRGYVARLFVRRHRLPIALSALFLLLLIAALVYALAANHRAQAAQRQAEARFSDVHDLANAMLFELNDRLGRVPGNTAARASLAAQAQRYLAALADSEDAPQELRLETARGLVRLARIQGVPTEPNLGEVEAALTSLDRALRLLGPLDMDDAVPTRVRAHSFKGLVLLHGESREKEARAQLDLAGKALADHPAGTGGDDWYDAQRVYRLASLEFADTSNETDKLPALVTAMRKDRAGWPEALRQSTRAKEDDALLAYYEGLALAAEDKLDAALAKHLEAEQAFDLLLAARRDDPVQLYRATWNGADGFRIASILYKDEIAGRLIRKAEETADRLALLDERDNAIATLRVNVKEAYAQYLRDIGDFAAALAMQQRVVDDKVAQLSPKGEGRDLSGLAFSQMVLGVIARDGGQRSRACEAWVRAQNNLEKAQATGDVIGFHASFLPGIRAHVIACRDGTSISAPMRE